LVVLSVARPGLPGQGGLFPGGVVAGFQDAPPGLGQRPAVPAPLHPRRGLEDLPASLPGLLQNLADAVLAAHDVIEDHAAEAAALRAHAHHAGEPVAPVEADQRTAVRNEEHRDLVVVLDLPAQPFGVAPLEPLHALDAEQDRAHVRLHALSPLVLGGDAHDHHARCGPVTRASRFLTGLVTRLAHAPRHPAGNSAADDRIEAGRAEPRRVASVSIKMRCGPAVIGHTAMGVPSIALRMVRAGRRAGRGASTRQHCIRSAYDVQPSIRLTTFAALCPTKWEKSTLTGTHWLICTRTEGLSNAPCPRGPTGRSATTRSSDMI